MMALFRLRLRGKLLLFSIIIAIIPLLIAGQSLIRIARDEMKSAANDQLLTTVDQVTGELDDVFTHAWIAPLLLIRSAIDESGLGIEEKIAILKHGIAQLPDVVALQISIEGSSLPLLISQERFVQKLTRHALNAASVLRSPDELLWVVKGTGAQRVASVDYIRETDDWLATIVLPMNSEVGGGKAVFSARIDLSRLRSYVESLPFTKTGTITIVDASGRQVFNAERPDLTELPIVAQALRALASSSRFTSVEPFSRPDGTAMLGAFSFPQPFTWAVIAEKSEHDAYLGVEIMIRSLLWWLAIGLAVAAIGALIFSLGISRPILAIGRTVIEVARGNFKTRVQNVHARDEIGMLAERINEMIVQLNERFQLAKFVSHGTMAAIKTSDDEGVKLGGQRREVAILFADVRGYTAFAEKRDPELVVEVLNLCFERQAEVISRHRGDIDKFVGDQIMAVFQGDGMAEDAVTCAIEMQEVMSQIDDEHPDWDLQIGIGIDLGDVIMGAMGSSQRMDYTVLGDHVNLAARLCSHAKPRQTLVTETVRERIADTGTIALEPLEPIRVKGKSVPLLVFDAYCKVVPFPKTASA